MPLSAPASEPSPIWDSNLHERFTRFRFDFDLPEELIAQQPPANAGKAECW